MAYHNVLDLYPLTGVFFHLIALENFVFRKTFIEKYLSSNYRPGIVLSKDINSLPSQSSHTHNFCSLSLS